MAKTAKKVSEIREKTAVELAAMSRDLRQELFNLRLQKASSRLENPARLRLLRREIARVETVLSELRRKVARG
ncbi:MAG: 50S ribosomal protein L29 [Verrucomicrobia bacterium]|nr:50S ribosomal protein L29 [Verrucomicrobiota bacterium]